MAGDGWRLRHGCGRAATWCDDGRSLVVWMYRIALFGAGALVGLAGHLGGLLVWGVNYLRP